MTCTQNKQTQGLCPQYGFNSSTNQINNSGFSYDASGDMLSDNSHTYQYDAEGRLISVDNGSTATYIYNALGERVEKDAGGNYTEYVFGLTQKPGGKYNRTAWTDTWVSFQGRHFAHFSNGDTYFVHADRIGTTNIVTDWNTGTVVQDELHYPWGQVWTTAGSSIEERFASLQHRDSESNLDPTEYRMFSSDAGRWTTPDPMDQFSASPTDPQSWNRYAYVLNNSTNFADPYGLCSRWQIVRGVAECVGGVAMAAGCLAGDASTGGLLTVVAVACASEGFGLAVQGSLNVLGGATSTNVSPAVNAVGSMGNIVGLTATVASGFNLNVGKGASIVSGFLSDGASVVAKGDYSGVLIDTGEAAFESNPVYLPPTEITVSGGYAPDVPIETDDYSSYEISPDAGGGGDSGGNYKLVDPFLNEDSADW